MKAAFDAAAGKRPVNLTLNEDLVKQAKAMTDNLSGVVESLLAEFVARQRQERLQRARSVEAAMVAWNRFNAQTGSIADEYATL